MMRLIEKRTQETIMILRDFWNPTHSFVSWPRRSSTMRLLMFPTTISHRDTIQPTFDSSIAHLLRPELIIASAHRPLIGFLRCLGSKESFGPLLNLFPGIRLHHDLCCMSSRNSTTCSDCSWNQIIGINVSVDAFNGWTGP